MVEEKDVEIVNGKTKEQLSLFRIKNALALGISIMVSEHFFSTFLSSPLTVETLYKDSKDKVMHYFTESAVASLGFGLLMDLILQDKYFLGFISALGITLMYYLVYQKALS